MTHVMIQPMTKATDKYRAKMRKAGFRYICLWAHPDDIGAMKAMALRRRRIMAIHEMAARIKKSK